MLITAIGDEWRRFRMERLIPYAGYAIAGMFVFVVLFYLIRGRVPIHAGPSDKRLLRYSAYERTIHWFIAAIFLFLALTGLTMLLGRSLLIPLLGLEIFPFWPPPARRATTCSTALLLALALVFFRFVRRNIYQRAILPGCCAEEGDRQKHVPPTSSNMGEKSMFWMLVLVGGDGDIG